MADYQSRLASQFYDRVRNIKRMLEAGMTKKDIADKLGISRTRLYEILDRAKERGLL